MMLEVNKMNLTISQLGFRYKNNKIIFYSLAIILLIMII